jgi:hypothetical protein
VVVEEREPLTVLFIAGSGRSGSTLLDRLLGQLPGFVAVGEVRYIWRESLTGVRACGCGERFSDCPFWTKVGDVGFGGWDRLDLEAIIELERSVARQRHLPMLQAPAIWPPFERRLRRFTDVMRRLYEAIASVSGAHVVVDSSKDPAYGSLLPHVSGIAPRMVHLVRDSRAVAYSWAKVTGRNAAAEALPLRFAPPVSALRWLLYNGMTDVLARRACSVRLRYEDLVEAPAAAMRRLVGFVGENPEIVEHSRLDVASFYLSADHTVVGNPMRMTRGAIDVRVDDEWMRSMRRADRTLVGGMTLPLLRRYGYVPARREQTAGRKTVNESG